MPACFMNPQEREGEGRRTAAKKRTCVNGGEGGIRTRDTPEGIPVFETGAFNHSATSPRNGFYCIRLAGFSRVTDEPTRRLCGGLGSRRIRRNVRAIIAVLCPCSPSFPRIFPTEPVARRRLRIGRNPPHPPTGMVRNWPDMSQALSPTLPEQFLLPLKSLQD